MKTSHTTRPLIAIYCGSQLGHHPIYQQKTIQLIEQLSQSGFGFVYGGASIGLMGVVADTALQQGSEVIGVMPSFMLDYEVAHQHLTEFYEVQNMHQRKALMAERANAFIALPGGFGTFEEILEIATWAQLNQHQKTFILYNMNGYYDHLIAQLHHAVQEGFLTLKNFQKLTICHELHDIIEILNTNLLDK